MYLNLGCGELPIRNAVNIDIKKGKHVDEVVDLRVIPWPWKDESIDGIYMINSLEHFENTYEVISECYRILKRGGGLYLEVPHSTDCNASGEPTHYRCFAYNALRGFLCQPSYVFNKPLFKEEMCRIIWWHLPRNSKHPYIKFDINYPSFDIMPWSLYLFIIKPLSFCIQKLIDLSPRLFERLWCYWVGGASVIVWKGIKL